MSDLDLTSFLYFLFAGISIFGIFFSGFYITKKQKKNKPYAIPEPKVLFILGIWILFYIIAFSLEFTGHFIGIWTWSDVSYIFLHAAIWWATLLTVSLFSLSALNAYLRYILLLAWVLLFEYLQEVVVHWVTHFPLLGTPYLMITIVMCVVSLISFKILDIIIGLKLLKKL